MINHYYNQKPTSDHDEKTINSFFFDKEFRFKTDAGVFSKNKIDYGTTLLINSFYGQENSKILDMCCGYGPIGISISSKLKSGEVIFTDINERAVALASDNIRINRKLIDENIKITIFQSDGFKEVIDRNFNYIIINPPIRAGKSVVFNLYEGAYNHLLDKGELWIVIQKKQGANSSIDKLEKLFKIVEIIKRSKGYFVIRCEK